MLKRPMMFVALSLFAMLIALQGSFAGTSGVSVFAQSDPDALVILPLDDGSGTVAAEISGSNNNGTLVNGAAFEAVSGDGSPFSVRFDGVNDYIDLGPVDVNGSGLTLATWLNADTFPGPSNDPRLISKASGTRTADHVYMLSTIRFGSAVRLRARVRIDGRVTTLIAASGDLQTGVWQHAALTYDGSALRLYLDGVEVGSTPLSGALDMDPALPVAVGSQPEGAGDRHFDGLLDDVRILQRALSAGEVAAIAGGDPLVLPTAVDDTYNTDEDVSLVVDAATGILANDVDNELPDDLTVTLVSDVSNGLLALNGDGSFDFTPDSDFYGEDSFAYEAVDGQSGAASAPATVTLTVNPINDAPAAVDDNYQALPETTLVVDVAGGVLANDPDPDLDPLQALLDSDVSNGTLVLNADGSFNYTPNAGFSGQDTFTYLTNDSLLDSNPAVVTISVGGTDNSAPQIVSGQIAFTKQVIGNGLDETHMVVSADFNGDGFIDAAATDYIDDSIFWYENDGNGGFVARLLDDDLNGAYPAHVADVDLDGDIDLLSAGYLGDTFAWYENDGAGQFTRHDIDTATDGPHSIVTGDMDKDGDVDLLTSSQDADNIAWYENDGANIFTRHIIDTTADGAKRAEFADVDGDGDMDVVSASFFSREIAWHENDGSQGFTKHLITSSARGAYFVSPADIDGDGHVDVLSASQTDNEIAWYQNLGGGSFEEHVLSNNALGARTVIAADVDNDGDLDALSASVNDNTVAWYANDGSGNFTTHGIDLTTPGAYGLSTADMDNDGDLDILSASRDAYEAAIHAQIRAHQVMLEVGGGVVIDDSVLLTVDQDDRPVDLIYTITESPALGTLELNGALISAGATLTQEDINSGSLAYVHNGVDATRDGFSFTVQDGGENGVRPNAGTFTFIFPNSGDAVLHLALDEGAGTLAEDVSGFGNDGELVNGATFEADSGDGSISSARFDGVDDRIDLDPADVNGTGLTLAAWFKADSFPGSSNDPRLISKSSGLVADAHVFMLSTVNSGSNIRLRFRVRVDGATKTFIAPSGDLQTGEWQHAAATYDGAMMRLYLDGVEVGSSRYSGAVDVEPLMPLAVGGQPAGAGERFFDGLLDDVRILQRALSAEEIAAIVAGS